MEHDKAGWIMMDDGAEWSTMEQGDGLGTDDLSD